MQLNGHGRESGVCAREIACRKENARESGTIIRGADGCGVRLSRIPFKVLLYDDLVSVVSFGHVTKLAIHHSIHRSHQYDTLMA